MLLLRLFTGTGAATALLPWREGHASLTSVHKFEQSPRSSPARIALKPSLSQPNGGFFVPAGGWILLNAFIARRAWSAALRLPALSTCSSAHTRYCKAASTSGFRCLANKRSLILRYAARDSRLKAQGELTISDNRQPMLAP